METGETRLRPSSETARVPIEGGLGAMNPISGQPTKWGRAERESEEVIVAMKAWTTEPAGAKDL